MRSLRFLRHIDLYFAKLFGTLALLCAMGMMSLVVVGDIFQKMDEFTNYAEKSAQSGWVVIWMLVKYYVTFSPSLLLQYTLPLVLLLAAVIAVTVTTMNNEYTALRAGGISMQRAILPILAVTLLIGYGVSWSRDWVLPFLLRKSHEINNEIRPRSSKPLQVPISDSRSFDGKEKADPDKEDKDIHIVSMGYFDSKKGIAYNLDIQIHNLNEFYAGKKTFVSLQTPKAYLRPHVSIDDEDDGDHEWEWVPEGKGRQMRQYSFGRKGTEWTEPLPTRITPAMLERQALGEAVMTWDDLSRLSDDLDIRLEKHRRISQPWVNLSLVLLGLVLVLRSSVRGQAPDYVKNMVIAVLLAAFFFVTQIGFESLGESEFLSPFLAAWMPNILLGGLGLWFYYDLER